MYFLRFEQSSKKISKMFAFYILVLAVCSVALPSVSAEERIRDNLQEFIDAFIDELKLAYDKSNGLIELPDLKQAKEGTLGDFRLIKKPGGLDLPSRADFDTENPRLIMFRFEIRGAHAIYKNYKPLYFTFFKKRTLNYEIEELSFFAYFTITVEENQCRLNFQKVRVTGEPGKVTVQGGLIESTNPVLESFIENSNSKIFEAARKDVESKLQDIIGNRYFPCSLYEPSKRFLTA